MKAIIFLTVTSGLLLSGCATGSQDEKAAVPVFSYSYHCESGAIVSAEYPSAKTAVIGYKNSQYTMTAAVSASGARYVGGGLEWWTKGSGPGSEGILSRLNEKGESSETIEQCTAS